MKITVDTKAFKSTLKVFTGFLKTAMDDKWEGLLFLKVLDGNLYVYASSSINSLCVRYAGEVEVESEGSALVSSRLIAMINSIRQDQVTLSAKKRLTISAKSGFTSRITISTIAFPHEAIDKLLGLSDAFRVTLVKQELFEFLSLSDVLKNDRRGVKLEVEENKVTGVIRATEYGSVDNFPFHTAVDIEGTTDTLTFLPNLVKASLVAAKETIHVACPEGSSSLIFSDEYDSWWAITQRLKND